jgi:type I restriction enzyme S subunit
MDGQANITEFTDGTEKSNEPETVRLKHLARINPTKSELSDLDPKTDVSFVPLEDFGTDGEIKDTETRPLEEVYDGYTYFREGDIAIAKITPSFENGKGAICRGLENGIGFGTTELHILRPREGVSTEFLWYVLRSKPFMDEAVTAMRGVAGQKRVPSSFIENFEIPQIRYDLQQRKAARLDKKISNIYQAIAVGNQLKDLLQQKRLSKIWEEITCSNGSEGQIQTDIPWLGKIPKSWDVAKVGWYYDIQLGKMLDAAEISGEHLAPYLRNQDVHWWDINTEELPKMDFTEDERNLYQLEQGDVLVCEGGFGCGESAVWRQDTEGVYYQKALHRVRANDGNQIPEFFCYFMEFAVKTGIFSANSNQSTIDHITVEKLSNQKMPIPPKRDQQEIVNRLSKMSTEVNSSISTINNLLSKLSEMRESVITAEITNQIDVSEAKHGG